MPKTYNNLFDDIVHFENLYRAFVEARKGKRYNRQVLKFQANLEENLINIQNQLLWGSWTPGRWREFMVYDPKQRLIHAPPFADRVVHHALHHVINPLFEKKFIADSYACRTGRGFHQAAKRVQYFLRRCRRNSGSVFVLQADISKYFPSIDPDVLRAILRRTIRDARTLSLCDSIIQQSGLGKTGIPVGALTSQLFANIYLDPLDHYIKESLGVKSYCRYMDDFVVIGGNKQDLWDVYIQSKNFIENRLMLTLNPRTNIYPARQGVDFCGYRVWSTHILPRKRTIKKARKTLRSLSIRCVRGDIPLIKIREQIMSLLGYLKHCNGHTTSKNILSKTKIRRIRRIKS